MIQTFVYSVIIAVLSTLISVVVGTWIAVLLEVESSWGGLSSWNDGSTTCTWNHLGYSL